MPRLLQVLLVNVPADFIVLQYWQIKAMAVQAGQIKAGEAHQQPTNPMYLLVLKKQAPMVPAALSLHSVLFVAIRVPAACYARIPAGLK